jgi:hypothetical protein
MLVLGFIAIMVWGVRRALPRWLGREQLEGEPSKGAVATVVCVVVAAALTTEIIGIHALFGAFLAGAIMPERGGFRHKLSLRVESFSSVLLLPLFFSACAALPKVPLDYTQGAVVSSISSEVSLSARSSGKSLSGHGFMVYQRPDKVHLVVLSPFGTTLMEVYTLGDRITLVYPSQGVAYAAKQLGIDVPAQLLARADAVIE